MTRKITAVCKKLFFLLVLLMLFQVINYCLKIFVNIIQAKLVNAFFEADGHIDGWKLIYDFFLDNGVNLSAQSIADYSAFMKFFTHNNTKTGIWVFGEVIIDFEFATTKKLPFSEEEVDLISIESVGFS